MFPSESNKVGMDYSYGAPEWEAFKSTLQYEERIVAFLDVMGWAEAIKQSVDDPELTKKLGMGIGYALNHKKAIDLMSMDGGQQATQFSDSVVLSVKSSTPHALESLLLFRIQVIINDFLSAGLLVRGAITQGLLIHQGSIVYGPALVKAYQLEQKEAIWPRVILDTCLVSTLSTSDFSTRNWRTDSDGKVFVNFLKHLSPPFSSIEETGNEAVYHAGLDSYKKMTLSSARKLTIKGLIENQQNAKVYAKYIWTAHYFNTTISEYPEVGMEPISIS